MRQSGVDLNNIFFFTEWVIFRTYVNCDSCRRSKTRVNTKRITNVDTPSASGHTSIVAKMKTPKRLLSAIVDDPEQRKLLDLYETIEV